MRYLLSVLLLPLLVPVASAQDNEAAQLFRDLERRIKAAKAVQITVDIELRAIKGKEEESKIKDVSKANGFLLLTKDKARLRISGEWVGMEMVSNGKQMKWESDEGEARSLDEAKAVAAPENLDGLQKLVGRAGVTISAIAMPYLVKYGGLAEGEEKVKPDRDKGALWDFKAGAAERVSGRDAKVISFRYGGEGDKDALPVTLWIDAHTLLPLKRVVVFSKENLHITEVYSEFRLDPRIDAKAFELIASEGNEAEKLVRAMEQKIKAAKAVQVTFDVTAKAKREEAKLKGSLLYTNDNKARLKISGSEMGKDVTIEMISNGQQMKLAESPERIAKVEAQPTPGDLHGLLSTLVSGPGVWPNSDLLSGLGPKFRLVYFNKGATEKIGGRNAKVVSCNAVMMGDTCQVTLWIDAETLLPLKRLVEGTTKEGDVVRLTENCSFNLNPQIEAEAFALPK